MSAKPILFKTDMIRAILDGRKTMTRRIVKNPAKPPCRKGDVLYIRETWAEIKNINSIHIKYVYRATDAYPFGVEGYIVKFRWHPPIYMPKEAARIWLKVTHVRLERLHDITNGEVLKEGANPETIESYIGQIPEKMTADRESLAHKIEFSRLWDDTVKKADIDRYGWHANPYVWAIEFERCEKPEEAQP